MARKADGNGGCGLIALCLVVMFAVGKCGGSADSPPGAQSPVSRIGQDTAAVATTTMYVTTATLNCRADPKPGASVIEKLARGDAVSAGETSDAWVSLDRVGQDCWVAQHFLSENQPEPEPAPATRPTRLYSPSSESLGALSSGRSGSSGGSSCGSKRTCGEMNSCAEAYHYLNDCGLGRLDRDGDGIPCESIC
ncbi:hypothetical protein ASE85_07820 [Sphingobium sp. Leaf26]|nr:hypothetical protein ASE85_07820 [Sphingobium sp. Leaf26]